MKNTKLFISLCLFLSTSLFTNLSCQETSVDSEVYKIVEAMPMFPGCEKEATTQLEKYSCAKSKLSDFISEHLIYPKKAIENNIEGTCFVQVVVNKNGSLSDIKLFKGIEEECDQAAVNAVSKMIDMNIKWIPGKQKGKTVNVLMTIPIMFTIPRD